MRRALAGLVAALLWVGGLTMPAFVPGTLTPVAPGPSVTPASGTLAPRGGGPFLTDQFPNARQYVQIAFGANVAAGADPGSWLWTDVTSRVLWTPGVNISSVGRINEASQSQPAQAGLTLKNADGALMPYNAFGAYWPGVQEDTPIRALLDLGGGATVRFQGYIYSYVARWDQSRNYVVMDLGASGILRRLQRNKLPVHSPFYRSMIAYKPVSYWPMEDGSAATQIADPVSGNTMVFSGNLGLGSGTGLAGSAALATPGVGSSASASVAAFPSTWSFASNGWTVSWVAKIPQQPAADTVLMEWWSADTSAMHYQVIVTTTGLVKLKLFDSTGTEKLSDTGTAFTPNANGSTYGRWLVWYVIAVRSGSDSFFSTNWTDSNSLVGSSNILTGHLSGAPTRVTISGTASAVDNFGVGHVGVEAYPFAPDQTAAFGWVGENAVTRLKRVCAEVGVPIAVTGTSDAPMGAQPTGDFMTVIRDCETTDGGILYDGVGPGLNYTSRKAIYNQSPQLTLDATGGQVMYPLPPVEDDLLRRNIALAAQPSGSSALAVDSSSALGTGAAGVGARDVQVPANTSDNGYLSRRAAHEVKLGTVAEMRVPTLSINLAKRPELAGPWLGVDPGTYVRAIDVAALFPQVSTTDIRALVNGYSERWNSKQWEVTMNTSPYRPWQVWALQDPVLGRVDTTSARLRDDAAVGATTLVLLMDGRAPTTSAGDMPFDLWISGIQVTVTAVSGSSPGPYTLTVTGSTVTKKLHAGDQVRLWQPATPAL